jgi:hypothetical protein
MTTGRTSEDHGMAHFGRSLVAIAAAIAGLIVGWLLDHTIMRNVHDDLVSGSTPAAATLVMSMTSIVVIAVILGVVVSAWRAGGIWLGVAYAVVGGFLTFLAPLVWAFATQINDVPPVLPEPVSTAIGRLYFETTAGPGDAMAHVAAAVFVVGVLLIGASFRSRRMTVERPSPVV